MIQNGKNILTKPTPAGQKKSTIAKPASRKKYAEENQNLCSREKPFERDQSKIREAIKQNHRGRKPKSSWQKTNICGKHEYAWQKINIGVALRGNLRGRKQSSAWHKTEICMAENQTDLPCTARAQEWRGAEKWQNGLQHRPYARGSARQPALPCRSLCAASATDSATPILFPAMLMFDLPRRCLFSATWFLCFCHADFRFMPRDF